eukprot:2648587-Rhodomonas_salina.4
MWRWLTGGWGASRWDYRVVVHLDTLVLLGGEGRAAPQTLRGDYIRNEQGRCRNGGRQAKGLAELTGIGGRSRGAAVCDGEAAGDIHEQGPDVDLRHVQRQEAGRHAVRRLPARRQDHVRQEGVRLPMAAADHQPGLHRGGAR